MTTPVGDESLVGVTAHHPRQALVALEHTGVHVVDPVGGPELGDPLGVSGVDPGGVGGEDPQDGQLVLGGVEAGTGVGDPGLGRREAGFEGVKAGGAGRGRHEPHINAPSHARNTL